MIGVDGTNQGQSTLGAILPPSRALPSFILHGSGLVVKKAKGTLPAVLSGNSPEKKAQAIPIPPLLWGGCGYLKGVNTHHLVGEGVPREEDEKVNPTSCGSQKGGGFSPVLV